MNSIYVALLIILVSTSAAICSDKVSQIPHDDMEFDEMAAYVHMATAHGDMKEGAAQLAKLRPTLRLLSTRTKTLILVL